MKTLKSLFLQYLFTCLLLFMAVRVKADGSGIFDRIIRLPRTEATVYQSLAKITEETGYLFIYDSKLIDNERKIKLKAENEPYVRPFMTSSAATVFNSALWISTLLSTNRKAW